MSWEVIVEPEAEQEFKEAVAWYDEKKAGVGQKLSQDIRKIIRRATQNPQRFRLVSRLTRKAQVPRWSYSVYFTLQEETRKLIVVAIFHASRDPGELQRRLR